MLAPRFIANIRERRRLRNPIYIVPTRYGIWLGITLIFMVLAGAVYSNNLVLIIAFLATTLGIAAMLETHARVLKIQIVSVVSPPGFADEGASFRVRVESRCRKNLPGLTLQIVNPNAFADRDSYSETFTIPAKAALNVEILGSPWPRGIHALSRVRAITSHRMGLFCAWRDFRVQSTLRRFPARQPTAVPFTRRAAGDGSGELARGFDFAGHRAFREGDDFRRLDWKLWARRKTKELKIFGEGGRPCEVLNWNDLSPRQGLERNLSSVAAWVDNCQRRGTDVRLLAPFCPAGSEDVTVILDLLARVPASTQERAPPHKQTLFKKLTGSRPARTMWEMILSPIAPEDRSPVARGQLIALTLFSAFGILQSSPRWLSLLSFFLAAYWVVAQWRGWNLPSRGVKILAMGIGAAFTFLEFHQLFGPEAGACLLTLFTLMKFFEPESYRDGQHTLILCLVMIAAGALLNPTIGTTLHAVLGVWLCGHYLLKMHEPDLPASQSLRDSFILLITALPLSAALFFFFPRLSLQLIQPSELSEQVRTGFSESLDPGSVSELVQTDDLQFRAYFDRPLAQRELYWRGTILHVQRGMQWRKGSFQPREFDATPIAPPTAHVKAGPGSRAASASAVNYRVLVQPHSQTSLFALEHAIFLRADTVENRLQPVSRFGGVYEWPKPFTSPLLYRGQARADSELAPQGLSGGEPLPVEEDRRYQAEADPRFLALVTDLQKQRADKNWSSRQVARQILHYYRDHDFRYTLEPGVNPNPSVSSFLFDWKRGFCEHYAGVTTTLLRALGIPAHVVIGYQGGEWNADSRHYTVTSRDAHAWLEAWDGERWFRVDPVEVLTPVRLDVGGRAFLDMLKSGWTGKLDLVAYQKWFDSQTPLQSLWRGIQNRTESLASRWNLFLLTFNYESQIANIRAMGLKALARLFVTLVGLAAAGGLLILAVRWGRRSPRARLERRFSKLLRRLESVSGLSLAQTGPLDVERYVEKLPRDDQSRARALLERYRREKYGA